MTWEENCGAKSLKMVKPCLDSLRLIVNNLNILLIGAVTSLFESVMYIFVFLWTPVLDPAQPPLGIVFACFMACVMIGGLLFEAAILRKISPINIIVIAILMGLTANVTSSFRKCQSPTENIYGILAP